MGMMDFRPVLEHLIRTNRYPILFFLFSRNGVEKAAQAMANRFALLGEEEATFVRNRAEELPERVRKMHRILIECLPAGFGFHHAGLLPSAKHLVEELFEKGYLPVVFCTETFALGVNFPARTVVFGSTTKRDDYSFRPLTNREVLQISGRAGRRGIDRIGYAYVPVDPDYPDDVFVTVPHNPEQVAARTEMTPLTVLRLIDRFEDNAEDIRKYLDLSFAVYKNRGYCAKLTAQIDKLKEKSRQLNETCRFLETGDVLCPASQFDLTKKVKQLKDEIRVSQGALNSTRNKQRKRKHARRIDENSALLAELEGSLRERLEVCQCSFYDEKQKRCPVRNESDELLHQCQGLERRFLDFPYSVEALISQYDAIKQPLSQGGFIHEGRLSGKGTVALAAGPAGVLLAEVLSIPGNGGDPTEGGDPARLAGITAGCLCERDERFKLKDSVWQVVKEARQNLLAAGFPPVDVLFNEEDAGAVHVFACSGDIVLAGAAGNMAPGDLVMLTRRAAEVLRSTATVVPQARDLLLTAHDIIWQEEVAEVMP